MVANYFPPPGKGLPALPVNQLTCIVGINVESGAAVQVLISEHPIVRVIAAKLQLMSPAEKFAGQIISIYPHVGAAVAL